MKFVDRPIHHKKIICDTTNLRLATITKDHYQQTTKLAQNYLKEIYELNDWKVVRFQSLERGRLNPSNTFWDSII